MATLQHLLNTRLYPEHAAGQDVSKEHRAEEQEKGGDEDPALPGGERPLEGQDRREIGRASCRERV